MTTATETTIATKTEHQIPGALLQKKVQVTVVGCGGTGSAIAAGLPYLHQAMVALADAIWPVLCDWHADYYRRGRGDPRAIAFGIEENISLLDGFRNRTVDTLCGADEPKIRELFWTFQKVTGRTNSRGSDASPVGAAKALHLLCPHFLSLWDNAIADLYRCDHEAFGYAKFCRLMKEFAAAVQPYLGTSDDRSVLKRIDEYNWSITRPRRAS